MLVGVWHNRPRVRRPWYLIAAGILLLSAGDTAYDIQTEILHIHNPYPSLADIACLAMYPLIAAGLLRLARAGPGGQDPRFFIDALILATGLGLLSWIFLISPHLLNPDLTLPQRLVSMAYPLGDGLILVTVARLVIVDRLSPTLVLLAMGAVGLMVSDVFFSLARMKGIWDIEGTIDLGWLVFYATWGAAALHPSMAALTEPQVARPREIGTGRQLMLLMSALLPPAVLLYEVAQGGVRHAGIIGVAAAVIGVLAFLRLRGLIIGHQRTTAQAETLRTTSTTLMSAAHVARVTAALQGATGRLLPPQRPHRIVVVMNDGSVPEIFPESLPRGVQMRYTRDLPAGIAARMGGFELTLTCPLALDNRPTGDPAIGMVLVAADEDSLRELQAPIEAMVPQAALAIERITLNAEVTRHNNERYFRALVRNAADVILIVDPDTYHIRYASPSAREVLGDRDLDGVSIIDLVEEGSRSTALDQLRHTSHDAQATSGDWVVVRLDGSHVQVQASCRDLTEEPTVEGTVVTLRDVTAERKMEADLTEQAFHDPLTGLPNRALFQKLLTESAQQARVDGAVTGVLFIDLDDFKVVNDTMGHGSGDELLRTVAQRLTAVLRHNDTAARIGGDEFAALIHNAPSATAVEEVATRIVAALAEPFIVHDQVASGIASVGIATTADAADTEDLLRQADLALYVAKDAGKGQWRRYQPELHTAFLQRLQLRTELEQSLAAGHFALEFQPIVTLPDAAIVGFEALVRWNHPTRGRLYPGQFIEIAEESGQIVPLGQWILANSLQTATRWHRDTDTAPYVSVNVSLRQFRSHGFLDSIDTALNAAALPPTQLMIEINESMLLRDDDRAWEDLAQLRERGVRIAVDDFGTGYSSLSYLRHVPLDAVKLDMLFTAAITTDPKQAALADGIIRLAHSLGLDVITEGIETPAQRDLLTRFGCHYGQGFLFSKPLTPDETVHLMTGGQQHVPAAF